MIWMLLISRYLCLSNANIQSIAEHASLSSRHGHDVVINNPSRFSDPVWKHCHYNMCQTLSTISLKQTQTSSRNPRTMRHLSESVRLSSDGGKNSSAVTCSAQASPQNQCLIYNGCSARKLKQQTSCKLQRRSSACRDFYSAETSGPGSLWSLFEAMQSEASEQSRVPAESDHTV